MHLGLIGYGSIATALIARLSASRVTRVTVLVRPTFSVPDRTDELPVQFVRDIDAFLNVKPDLIVECAGHSAVTDHVPPCLAAGHDVIIASVGALADVALAERIAAAETRGGARAILPNGAIGGLDLLRAISLAGDVDVIYRGIKPPQAWRGSPAETLIDLTSITQATTFFQGNGRDAALAFPKNANVVAALALAGAGFERMRVELIADPGATGNRHAYTVASPLCRYTMDIEATGAAGNARTSVTTVLSLLQEILTYTSSL